MAILPYKILDLNNNEIIDPDLKQGWLQLDQHEIIQDKIFEKSHIYLSSINFEDGYSMVLEENDPHVDGYEFHWLDGEQNHGAIRGRSFSKVIDVPAQEEKITYEKIYRYIPYTAEELQEKEFISTEIPERFSKLENSTTTLNNRIDITDSNIQEKYEILVEENQNLNSNFDEKYTNLNNTINTHSSNLNTVQTKINQLDMTVKENIESFNELNATMENQYSILSDNYTILSNSTDSLQSNQSQLESEISSHSRDLFYLNQDMNDVIENVAELSGSDVEERVTNAESEIENTQTTIDDILLLMADLVGGETEEEVVSE